jgi:hypothetical protein
MTADSATRQVMAEIEAAKRDFALLVKWVAQSDDRIRNLWNQHLPSLADDGRTVCYGCSQRGTSWPCISAQIAREARARRMIPAPRESP